MREYTPENPKFHQSIPIVETTDPAHADNVNAAPKALLENDLALKKEIAETSKRHVFASRPRDPDKPDYGLGGGGEDGGEFIAALHVGPYTGTAEVSATLSGVEFDAYNLSPAGGAIPDGNIIFNGGNDNG